MANQISIKGARVNNLKNIDVDIERDKFTVVTGVSGSGKSSLVFDLIYAEGFNYLLDCLPSSVTRFLPPLSKPDVDLITGLSPVFALKQNRASVNPRSTVGTITNIYNQLRVLFSMLGQPHCPYCNEEIIVMPCSFLAEKLSKYSNGTIIDITAPISKEYNDSYESFFNTMMKRGFSRFTIDGEKFDSNRDELDESKNYKQIQVVIDKLTVQPDNYKQILRAIERAVNMGEGFVCIKTNTTDNNNFYEKACDKHQMFMCDLQPKYFTYFNEESACPTCKETGLSRKVDPERLIVNEKLSLAGRATIAIYELRRVDQHRRNVYASLLKHLGYSMDTVWQDLPDNVKNAVIYGMNGEKFELLNESDMSGTGKYITYDGLIKELENHFKYIQRTPNYKLSMCDTRIIDGCTYYGGCPDCNQTRLKSNRQLITLQRKTISDTCEMPVDELYEFVDSIFIEEHKQKAISPIYNELKLKLRLLNEIGLNYLQINRNNDSLSGGEYQRVKLTTQLSSKLMGILYVLDEPSIGLHDRDTIKIINVFKQLRDLGNTVLVVEHDFNTIKEADQIIEIGPGAGVHGGQIVAQGSVEEIKNNKDSVTGQYLKGSLKIDVPAMRRAGNRKYMMITGAADFNLKNIDVKIPLGMFICVTGISGSGKSTLINYILYTRKSIEGIENIKNRLVIDQSPIGWRKNSNPATYIGYYDEIRNVFAQTEEAKACNYTPSHFSFNVEGGRCEVCKGYGYIENSQYIAEAEILCPECNGKRFTKEILSVEYKEKNIDDILNMPVSEGVIFFKDNNYICSRLKVLEELGLGYMKIGQPTHTLSGGESQRIKLATELVKRQKSSNLLYILDEPTTGLGVSDIAKLLICLNRLVDSGNTVLVVEHNMDVIKTADYVIDLGPEGGKNGGYLLAAGTPEEVSMVEQSYTGQYLKKYL